MSRTESITTQWRHALSFRNISAVYIFSAIFATFSIVTPETFLQEGVWRTLLDAQAITVIAAIGVMIPLTTGSFNLAIGAEVGFAGILVAVLVCSSDAKELVRLCDRVAVMRNGVVVTELTGDGLTESALVSEGHGFTTTTTP